MATQPPRFDTTHTLALDEHRYQFEMTPRGPFSLAVTKEYFGTWTTSGPDQVAVVLAFPVEGWRTSAAVIVRQDNDMRIRGEIYGVGEEGEQAWQQALAVFSLDCDGSAWPHVGQRDPLIGNVQSTSHFLRPVLFHSPYEAAASFIIGHRISMQQGRKLRQALAEAIGEQIHTAGATVYAFPHPQILRELESFQGINAEKIERLHGVAQAALDGLLDRAYLRSLPVEQALRELRTIRGVGDFFAQAILMRGAGLVDSLVNDATTKQAIQLLYQLPQEPDQATVEQMAETWRPYRMWTTVQLHVWLRREMGGPRRQKE
jgi:DNA-3-methyladenine glycosylase II